MPTLADAIGKGWASFAGRSTGRTPELLRKLSLPPGDGEACRSGGERAWAQPNPLAVQAALLPKRRLEQEHAQFGLMTRFFQLPLRSAVLSGFVRLFDRTFLAKNPLCLLDLALDLLPIRHFEFRISPAAFLKNVSLCIRSGVWSSIAVFAVIGHRMPPFTFMMVRTSCALQIVEAAATIRPTISFHSALF